MSKKSHLYLIDGSSFIFRAYYALPAITNKHNNMQIGAVYGFCSMLWKLIRDIYLIKEENYIAIIADTPEKTFRNKIYPKYKNNRPPIPKELIPQFSIIKDLVKIFNISYIEKNGFEADDIIATYTKQAVVENMKVTIVTSDKDLMQLINDNVTILDTMKNKIISYDDVIKKFGVPPNRVIDVQSLAGDYVDNIPGIPGIGIKTASLLINKYGNLEILLKNINEIKQKKRKENLFKFIKLAYISRDLVTLKIDVQLKEKIIDFKFKYPNINKLTNYLFNIGLISMAKRIIATQSTSNLYLNTVIKSKKYTPKNLIKKIQHKISLIPIKTKNYKCITTINSLNNLVKKIYDNGQVSFNLITDNINPIIANIIGISLSLKIGHGVYIPIAHENKIEKLDLFIENKNSRIINQLDSKIVLKNIGEIFEDKSILKISENIKYYISVLKKYNIHLKSFHDIILLSSVLDTGYTNHTIDDLSIYHFNHKLIKSKDICGKGKNKIIFNCIPLDKATEYSAEKTDIITRIFNILYPRLSAEKMTYIYQNIEHLLVDILVNMEHHGILIDRIKLNKLSNNFTIELKNLTKEIYKLSGEEFNISSPKQLSNILFNKLEITNNKKNKTGSWQTNAKVLNKLVIEGHELPKKILKWRKIFKLKSTYTDSLLNHINIKTNKIHTNYTMVHTTTGRLSSICPNLQNIPIKTKEGRMIRSAFIASKGCKLIFADYSQIELRLLAHIANLKTMKKAFINGIDIHALIASEIFNTPIKNMNPIIRRKAKAINFGIIYGISAFGLASQLNISRTKAKNYIEKYFERFPGIINFIENTKQFARDNKYVKTIFGRVYHTPLINHKNAIKRALTERSAINMPIQGTAADIIKRAMIKIPRAFKNAGLKSKMLLQIHDELIFESIDEEINQTIIIIKHIMENANKPMVNIDVPLKVDIHTSLNWNNF